MGRRDDVIKQLSRFVEDVKERGESSDENLLYAANFIGSIIGPNLDDDGYYDPINDGYGSTWEKAKAGDRTSVVEIYRQFIREYENSLIVSRGSLEFLYIILKDILEVDADSSIDRNNNPQRLKKALKLDGRHVSEGAKRDEFIAITSLFLSINNPNDTPEQRNKKLREILEESRFNVPEEKHEVSSLISKALKDKK